MLHILRFADVISILPCPIFKGLSVLKIVHAEKTWLLGIDPPDYIDFSTAAQSTFAASQTLL